MFLFRFNLFWEVLVFLNDTEFVFPPEIPAKYKRRCRQRNGNILWIASERHKDPYYTNRTSLKEGMWICQDDFTPRGNVAPTVFGISLPPNPFIESLPILNSWSLTTLHVRVAYHGTSKESFKEIVHSELKCTYGMLGTGIYIGSFWKACRFAARDQLYQEREHPTIMRILWACEDSDILHFPRSFLDGYCLCARCYLTPEQKPFCAHVADFTRNAKFPPEKPLFKGVWKAGQLLPCKYPSGKWVTQNEEWIINPSLLLGIQQAIELDKSTIARPHYDPLQRNIGVL